MTRTYWARERIGPDAPDAQPTHIYGFSSRLHRDLWAAKAPRGKRADYWRESANATDPDVRRIARAPPHAYEVWAAYHHDPDLDHGEEPEPTPGRARFPPEAESEWP